MPFCCGQCLVMNSCRKAYPRTIRLYALGLRTNPLSDLSRNDRSTPPKLPKRAINGLLKRRCWRRRSAAYLELPAEQVAGVEVDHERQSLPTVTTCPDPAQIGSPVLVRYCRHLGQCFDARTISKGSLAYLPVHQLEHVLNRVLVERKNAHNRSITKGRLRFDGVTPIRSDSQLPSTGSSLSDLIGATPPKYVIRLGF
jgi:hypothetical protein